MQPWPTHRYRISKGVAHVQRSDGWIETTSNNMSDPGAFAAAGAEEQEGGMASRHRLPALVWSSA